MRASLTLVRKIRAGLLLCIFIALPTGSLFTPVAQGQEQESVVERKIDFAGDVQPILRRHCYRCHGSKNQESDLQLNHRQKTFGNDSIIVKGDAHTSLLIARLVDPDQGDIMPLDADPLSKKEIAVLSQWIDQGATWPDELAEAKHWAYQPISRPSIERSDKAGSASHAADTPIDYFVRQRIQQNSLEPSRPADRARLIRRVSLALVGVPPSPAQIQAFVNDPAPDAYEKVVDRLLRSQRYGERWAVPWLDLARYADSNGFQADQIRDNWAYRDWVIRSFNDDQPFNEFVIDQIAGDLRPNATVDQKIATGFHRMTTCNVEAGVHPEANRTNQIVDRVNTTATVFMGTTLECAQCHDHKYDPFSQKDYYRLFAYFNSTPMEVEFKSGVTYEFAGPKMDLPMSESKQQEFKRLTGEVESLTAKRKQIFKDDNKQYLQWVKRVRQIDPTDNHWQAVTPTIFETDNNGDFTIQDDGAVLLQGKVPDKVVYTLTFDGDPSSEPVSAIKIELLIDDTIAGKGPGRGDPVRSNVILSELTCDHGNDDGWDAIDLQDPAADFSQKNWDVSDAIDGNDKTGWAISPQFGKPHWATFKFKKPVDFRQADQSLRVTMGQFYGRGRVAGKIRVSLFAGDSEFLSIDKKLIELAKIKKPTNKQRKLLRTEFDKNNPRLKEIDRQIAASTKQRDALNPDTTLVMVEMQKPRETFVMIRGEYDAPGDRVTAGVPAILPGITAKETNETTDAATDVPATGDRMELARWLTSPQNPLLARVTVNRWWGELFGTGLVNTPEDFGSQAEDPSHPQLLDWLASELIDSGWSMKRLHKQIVMSATFQQDARITEKMLQVDPKNRLLARGPRFRLPAEAIRDNALAISGLMSSKMFGPPIMPYQPDDIWRSVGRNQPKWSAAQNEDRFRRGVYVICKRAAPYPSFINFDAPDRGSCTVQRGRSNTPLQALTLLNDPAYAEMALAMADRILSNDKLTDDESRLAYAMQLAVSRTATTYETSVLKQLLSRERDVVNSDKTILESRTAVPFDAMRLKTKDKAELAAWFAVTNALLNLDETMSQ